MGYVIVFVFGVVCVMLWKDYQEKTSTWFVENSYHFIKLMDSYYVDAVVNINDEKVYFEYSENGSVYKFSLSLTNAKNLYDGIKRGKEFDVAKFYQENRP